MIEVDVKALEASLREYLERAGRGERVVVTQDGRPVAVLSAVSAVEEREEPPSASAGLAGWKVGRRTVPPPKKSAVERLFKK